MDLYQASVLFLQKIGFFDLILPWLLVYAVVYGILLRTQIFGNPYEAQNGKLTAAAKTARNLSSIAALAIASLVIGSYKAVTSIKGLVPLVTIFILIIFLLVVVLAAFGLPEGSMDFYTKIKKYLAIPAIIIFIYIVLNYFGLASGTSGFGGFWQQYKDAIAGIFVLVSFIIIAYLISRGEGSTANQNNKQ